MDKLYSLWKEKDLTGTGLRLDGEESSKNRNVFSKVFKLDENNQYGFAMTKPLPIGIFKKQSDPNMETLENLLKNFDPNAKIGEVFVVDIHLMLMMTPVKGYITRSIRVFFNQRVKFYQIVEVFINCFPTCVLVKEVICLVLRLPKKLVQR